MALLDVTDVLFDPDLTDTFTVERRVETVGSNGRSTTSVTAFSGLGVVTSAGPNDLARLDDSQRMGRVISIVTAANLRGAVNGYQPDVIQWRGNRFVIATIDNYPQFGSGFTQAICVGMDLVDAAL